jgi:hypothetical protein
MSFNLCNNEQFSDKSKAIINDNTRVLIQFKKYSVQFFTFPSEYLL